MDNAKEFFNQAANCYKHCQDNRSSMEMYLKCAECESDEGFKANYVRDAGQVIKNLDTEQYIKLISHAIELYSISGRNTQASSLSKECAEKLEEDYNYEDALKFYEKAAQLYEMDNSVTYANQMNAKWADLSVLVDNMKAIAKIIKTYDKIGKKYMSQPLIKSSAKDYFFKACLCYLANDDMPGAKTAVENYTYEDPNFDTSK